MSKLEERLKSLSPTKRRVLIQRMRDKGARIPLKLYPIFRADRPLLTENQRRIWFLQELDQSHSVAYHIPLVVQLTGPLQVELLEQALNEVIARHEALRTSFRTTDDGEPYQATAGELRLSITAIDAPSDDAAWLPKQLGAEVTRPFDFENGPLLRARLFRLEPEVHIFSLVFHHIISDGWSLGVFVQEIVESYTARVEAREPQLAHLPVQYADYADWRRHLSQEEHADYWQAALEEFEPLRLPQMDGDKSLPLSAARSVDFQIELGLADRLRRLCREVDCTMFMVLLGAFQLTLGRYCGQNDVSLGTTVAGRDQAELEGLIGYFSTAVVVRSRLEPRLAVREFLAQVRDNALGAIEHQSHLPFDQIAVDQGLPRTDSNPFFEVMFVFQNLGKASLTMSDVEVSPVDMSEWEQDGRLAKFDLELEIDDSAGPLHGHFGFRAARFGHRAIGNLANHFIHVLDQFAKNPEGLLAGVQLPAPDEQTTIRHWARGPQQAIDESTLHGLFADQVRKTPDRTAVQWRDEVWSYAELNRRADEVARHLAQAGCRRGSTVGVCLQRSATLIATLLGVMKAGGSYVPLEPDLPALRLDYLVQDCGARFVVCDNETRQLTDWASATTICIDDELPPPPALVTTQVGPEDVAYVIYTSGTTGHPKGVMVSHRSAVNHLRSKVQMCGYRGDERFLCRSSFSFDASVTEIFTPLIIGGGLVVAEAGGHRDPAYLLGLIRDHNINVMEAVPSSLGMLLDRPDFDDCTSLEKVVLGGEALSPSMRDSFYDKLGDATLFNPYGPTEATVETTMHECIRGATSVSIGGPMHNYEVRVLDASLQLQPAGVPGELCIAGDGLAIGYRGKPSLTAMAFVPCPDAQRRGGRMYRSGDHVRWVDGQLEFEGRRDHQIQVRGVRVELEEIETILRSLPGVGDAVVVAVNEAEGRADSIVAYIVPASVESD